MISTTEYFDSTVRDVIAVSQTKKPLCIVSAGKDIVAYEAACIMAYEMGLSHTYTSLRCEDAKIHEHLFIAGPESQHRVDLALELIEGCKAGTISRAELQLALGRCLGYSDGDCVNFIASAVSRECPCDCCGGPFVPEEYYDR